MPAEVVKHESPRRKDDTKGQEFAHLLWEALARWEVTAPLIASGKVRSGLAHRLSGYIAPHYHRRTGKYYDRVQVGRDLHGERRTFDDDALIEAWSEAVPTLDRIEVYAKVGLLPPELRNPDDLRDVVRLFARRSRAAGNGHTDQGGRGTAQYRVGAGAPTAVAATA